jgi:hypothetical protein
MEPPPAKGSRTRGGPSAEGFPDEGAGLLQLRVLPLNGLIGGQVPHQAEEGLPTVGIIREEGGQGGGAGGGQGPSGPPDVQGGDVPVADVLLANGLLRDRPDGEIDFDEAQVGHPPPSFSGLRS